MLDDEYPRIHLHKPHHTHYCNICDVTMPLTWVGNAGKATGNYVTKLIVTEDKQHIEPELVDKLVTLRMNKVFMKFLRENKCCGLINLIAGINEILENEDEELWS